MFTLLLLPPSPGFADIPSGLGCPYIVRRGLLGTAAMPRPQRDPGQSEGGQEDPD